MASWCNLQDLTEETFVQYMRRQETPYPHHHTGHLNLHNHQMGFGYDSMGVPLFHATETKSIEAQRRDRYANRPPMCPT